MSKVFLDTNVLVYAADGRTPKKQRRARELLKEVAARGDGVVSTQVLQEFYVAATRKLGIEPLPAKAMLHPFTHFEVVTITPELIEQAVDCAVLLELSFWDALIVVAAESARCTTLWTEDLNEGQVMRGVRVENPFRH